MADRWEAGEAAALEACELAVNVRDDLPAAHRQVARLARAGTLPAVAVALAAMVPDDRPAAELLAWTDGLAPEPTARQLYDAERYRRRRADGDGTRGPGGHPAGSLSKLRGSART